MRKDNIECIRGMKEDYPKTPKHFQNMIKARISEQIGEEKAEQICGKTQEFKKKRSFKQPLKWVAVVAIVLVFGTTVAAATDSEFVNYLIQLVKEEDVYSYMQDVEPSVRENAQEDGNNILCELDLSEETPLWEIVNAWYDGVTIYFSATPGEEAEKMFERYQICPSDHCTVNGQDYMLECSDAEFGEGSLSEGEQTGQYHFRIDLADRDISESLEISFQLNISERDENVVGYATQEISFNVENKDYVIKTVDEEKREIFLSNGVDKAEILSLKLAPSVLYAKVKYIFYGENARERAEELRGKEISGQYYVEDSFGCKIEGTYPYVIPAVEIVEETDGGCSVLFEWETRGINADTDSLTFMPSSIHLGSDGKFQSETMLEWAVFTVPLVEKEYRN